MTKRARSLPVLLVGVFVLPVLLFPDRCQAAEAGIHVTQVKASNDGPESVDPALGELGQKLKEKYRYRNFKLAGSTSRSAAEGHSTEFSLANGMNLSVKVISVKGNTVELNLAITQGAQSIQTLKMSPRSGATFLISVPWGKDLLVLAIRPTAT